MRSSVKQACIMAMMSLMTCGVSSDAITATSFRARGLQQQQQQQQQQQC
jgi:hypothetical protein